MSNVIFIPSIDSIPPFDLVLASATYSALIEWLGEQFIQMWAD